MAEGPPQLGQMPGINLGGYIPAPVDRTLRTNLLLPMLAQFGAHMAGGVVDKLMTPDLAASMSPGGSGALPTANWHQKPVDPSAAIQYKMQAPVAAAQAKSLSAGAEHTAAETPYVGPLAESEIASRKAGEGLTGAQTQHIQSMTPAELDEIRARTTETGSRTGLNKAQTDEIKALTPEKAALARSETVKNVSEAQGQAGRNAAGVSSAEAGKLRAETGEASSRQALIDQQVGAAKSPLEATNTAMTVGARVEGSVLARYPEGKSRDAAKKALREFRAQHGSIPYDGDWTKYINELDVYVGKRAQ